MGTEAKITSKQLREAMQDEIRALVQEVTGAVNEAPDGSVISGSEEAVRDAMAKFRQQVYERAIQLRSQAAQAAFSPSEACQDPGLAAQGESGGQPSDGERNDSDLSDDLVV
jgi:hypothetical protein